MSSISLRVRSAGWFLIGVVATLITTLVVVNAWQADAAPGDEDSTFVPITPCRLLDTRQAGQTAFGAGETRTLDAHGANGSCVVPGDAVALSMNVTGTDATLQTFVTIWPADAPMPTASSLNPGFGQPPAPNAVITDLSPSGQFKVFNDTGTVQIIIDFNGYYTQTSLQDLVAELALKAGAADVYTKTEIDALLNVVSAADGCDGIMAALDGLPSGGGEVVVGAGTFECDEPIVIDRDHVTLRGSGPSTVLGLADGANSPLVVIGDTDEPPAVLHHHVVVSDLRLEGNSATQLDECWGGPCAGPNFRPIRNNTLTIRKAHDVLVEDVITSDARSGGLVIERGSRRITVRGFEAFGHVFDGLAAYLTEDSTFTDLMLHDNAAAGLSLDDDFDNNVLSDVVITGTGTVGIFMRDSHDNVFSDMQIRGSTEHGIFIAQNGSDASTAATGNTFDGLLVEGSGGDGIHIANPSNVNTIFDDVQYAGNTGACLITSGAPVILGETICR